MLSRREVDSAELTWPLVMSKKKAAALVWQPIFSDGINESDWAQVMMRWDNIYIYIYIYGYIIYDKYVAHIIGK